MEKSINALLNNNLRVIIPDFGAFIIRQKEPRIVVFNEFLRYDDGLLTEYIAKTEGIERETALQLVADFTTNITRILESGKPYNLKGLGKLHQDSSGKIFFDAEVTIMPPEKTEQESAELPVIEPEDKPPAKARPKRPVKSDTVPAEETQAPMEPPIPDIPEITVVKISEPVKVPEPLERVISRTVVPAEESINTENIENLEVPTTIPINLILKWIILILCVNAVIFAWFIFGDDIRGMFKKKAVPATLTDSVFNMLSDSVRVAATDTTIIFRETADLSSAESSLPVEVSLRYYIVAGCFRDEVNADELVKSLKDRGFRAEKFGKIGNLYAVSFASFDDKEMAVKELKRIREEVQPEAWMTQFK
jgi:nucleoid DNA-binding protein